MEKVRRIYWRSQFQQVPIQLKQSIGRLLHAEPQDVILGTAPLMESTCLQWFDV